MICTTGNAILIIDGIASSAGEVPADSNHLLEDFIATAAYVPTYGSLYVKVFDYGFVYFNVRSVAARCILGGTRDRVIRCFHQII